MKRADSTTVATENEKSNMVNSAAGLMVLLPYMLYYLLITYLTVIVSFNLPFLLGDLKYDSEVAGDVISLFFLAIMVPGFIIAPILRAIKGSVEWVCLLLIAVGLLLVSLSSSLWIIAMGCIVLGVGYGIAQPYLYDRVAHIVSAERVTFALALLMSMNYVAILVCPVIIDFF
jgi:predicted MFS family arabinose efflux permease